MKTQRFFDNFHLTRNWVASKPMTSRGETLDIGERKINLLCVSPPSYTTYHPPFPSDNKATFALPEEKAVTLLLNSHTLGGTKE